MSVLQVAGKRKQCRNEDADRISNLPSLVTERILECLPLQDAVRTSILSTHWRYQWAQLPQLVLDEHFFDRVLQMNSRTGTSDKLLASYLNIVNTVLSEYVGPIRKFVFYIPSCVQNSVGVTPLIEFVSENSVKEFTLHNNSHLERKLPSCFFSCVGLTHLTLINCCIEYGSAQPATLGRFPSITSLNFKEGGVSSIDKYNTLENLVSNCPQLESLTIVVAKIFQGYTICAPKLLHLVIRGYAIIYIHLQGNNKLQTLSLELTWLWTEALENFFSCLPNLEMLVLGGTFWQVWHFEGAPNFQNKLGRLKTLKLVEIPTYCPGAMSFALNFLGRCSHLQQLEIEVGSPCKIIGCGDMLFEIKEDCSLQHLKNVAVNCISGSSNELQLIKLLLACSPVLEVMTIKLKKEMEDADQEKLASQLLVYDRASSKAEIILIFKV